MKTLIIDNYDSFTYNLYQMIAQINEEEPVVIYNNSSKLKNLCFSDYDNIVISPGPGHPNQLADFGFCTRILLESSIPVLGVCLGHQGICTAYGGDVSCAPLPMHGRISRISHQGDTLFTDIPSSFYAVRYHSLIIQDPLPHGLLVTARTDDGLIMGVRHQTRPIWGIQYHPESVCTEHGEQLLRNFMQLSRVSHPSRIETVRIPKRACSSLSNDSTKPQLRVKKSEQFYSPEFVYEKLFSKENHMVWLDSSRIIPGSSRFSFMGCLNGPLSYSISYHMATQTITRRQGEKTTIISMSIFDFLKQELEKYTIQENDLPFHFQCGFIGYFGYELYAESLPFTEAHSSEHPDAQFLFLDRVIVFDHRDKCCYFLALDIQENAAETWFANLEPHLNKSSQAAILNKKEQKKAQSANYSLSRPRHIYLDDIKNCLNHIHQGDSYEICLTNKLHFQGPIDAYAYYKRLRKMNPAPYAAYLRFDKLFIASSSIERFLLIDKEGHVETKPIKGTLPRGANEDEDKQLINKLQQDEKFRAENLMIVDLLRNDLGKVCEVGSVRVTGLMQVETYQTVHQLVSTIHGKLKQNISAIDCIKALFPGGSMTGAPKLRTVQILNRLEREARGVYSGALGYLSLQGACDFSIVIRTAVMTENYLSIGVGGAIIALSDAEDEFDEMILKSSVLQKAYQETSQESE